MTAWELIGVGMVLVVIVVGLVVAGYYERACLVTLVCARQAQPEGEESGIDRSV